MLHNDLQECFVLGTWENYCLRRYNHNLFTAWMILLADSHRKSELFLPHQRSKQRFGFGSLKNSSVIKCLTYLSLFQCYPESINHELWNDRTALIVWTCSRLFETNWRVLPFSPPPLANVPVTSRGRYHDNFRRYQLTNRERYFRCRLNTDRHEVHILSARVPDSSSGGLVGCVSFRPRFRIIQF